MTELDNEKCAPARARQDRDGYISREEMEDVVGSVFDLMGRTGDPAAEEEIIALRVSEIFEVGDANHVKKGERQVA